MRVRPGNEQQRRGTSDRLAETSARESDRPVARDSLTPAQLSFARHQEADPGSRAEASDAVAYYTERFRNMFRDAGESVNEIGQQVNDWLRRRRAEDPDD